MSSSSPPPTVYTFGDAAVATKVFGAGHTHVLDGATPVGNNFMVVLIGYFLLPAEWDTTLVVHLVSGAATPYKRGSNRLELQYQGDKIVGDVDNDARAYVHEQYKKALGDLVRAVYLTSHIGALTAAVRASALRAPHDLVRMATGAPQTRAVEVSKVFADGMAGFVASGITYVDTMTAADLVVYTVPLGAAHGALASLNIYLHEYTEMTRATALAIDNLIKTSGPNEQAVPEGMTPADRHLVILGVLARMQASARPIAPPAKHASVTEELERVSASAQALDITLGKLDLANL
ncbi:MAG: hypothetical protein Q7V62_14295 [Actinomycetota bacterium]|nr:hypothetical protein [Actinomycetota bacterium]